MHGRRRREGAASVGATGAMGYHRRMGQPAGTRMRTAYSDVELEALMADVESDVVERKATLKMALADWLRQQSTA